MLCNRTSLGEHQPLLSLVARMSPSLAVSRQQSAVSKRRESEFPPTKNC